MSKKAGRPLKKEIIRSQEEINLLLNTIYNSIRELIRKFRAYFRKDFFNNFQKSGDADYCEAHAKEYYLKIHPSGEEIY